MTRWPDTMGRAAVLVHICVALAGMLLILQWMVTQ